MFLKWFKMFFKKKGCKTFVIIFVIYIVYIKYFFESEVRNVKSFGFGKSQRGGKRHKGRNMTLF